MENNNKKVSILPFIIIGVVFVIFAIIAVLVILFVINGEPREKIYLTENEVKQIYGSPENYKKKYVKLTAQILTISYDKKSQTIRAWAGIEDFTNEITVYFEDKTVTLKENDYISIDGYIKGADKVTGKPYIIAKELKAISYKDAYAPTTKEVNVDKTVSQNDVSVTIQKVEFSEKETRVYVKATNGSNTEFSLYSSLASLTQGGKQYEIAYSKNSVDMASTILAGGSTEGVIVFPKIDESNFNIAMKGSSSNIDIKFENYVFDILVN